MSNESQSQMKSCFNALKLNALNNKIPFYKEAVSLQESVENHYALYSNSTSYKRDVPIKRIDGIPVDITLSVNKHGNFYSIRIIIHELNIYLRDCKCVDSYECGCEPDKILLYHDDLKMTEQGCRLTTEDYIEALEKFQETFQTIRFSKYSGTFVKKTTTQLTSSFWDKVIGDNAKIEKKYGNCCVCLEATISKTKCCSQSLCIECFGNIKGRLCDECNNETDGCDNSFCGDKPCPLCRKSLNNGQNM